MSLPLPHRIAQAALLVGAVAAPLIGAGAAQAAAPHLPDLGGLTTLDGAGLGNGVDGAARNATGLATRTGTDTLHTALPAAGRIVGTTSSAATPAARHTTGQATDTAGRLLGAAAESAGGAVPAAQTLPASTLPDAGPLPLGTGLPTGLSGLPLG